MKTHTIIYSLYTIATPVALLKQLMQTARVFTFTGTLGAGKTTLVQELLRACGITELLGSPTFTYVNYYENSQHEQFYHFDLYRIGSIDEFINAGFNEYLYAPGSWSFIEWPEVIMPLLTHQLCQVHIEYHGQERKITIIEN